MHDDSYIRKVQTSVTNFIHCGDEYLFIHRRKDKRIDPDRLNGIGGRVDPEENFLDALIRETEEETGYKIEPQDISLSGIVKLEGGYAEDWVMCFFKTQVETKVIPRGETTEDGELVWIHKDKVLDSGYELVDDLNYCFKDIVNGKDLFFMSCKVNENEKIAKTSITKLRQ